MGFFTALSRMIKGEPVFQPGDGHSSKPASPVQPLSDHPAPTPLSGTGAVRKVYPKIELGESDCDVDGPHMRCDLEIQNDSNTQLDIDIVRMLGSSRDMGTFLRPGEARKFMVYNGPVPKSTANNRCTIAFRTHPGGDHFTADALLEFKKLPSGGYAVARIRGLAIKDT